MAALNCSPEPPVEPPELREMHICDLCGEIIYEGDMFYQIDDRNICENCIENSHHEAIWEENEE